MERPRAHGGGRLHSEPRARSLGSVNRKRSVRPVEALARELFRRKLRRAGRRRVNPGTCARPSSRCFRSHRRRWQSGAPIRPRRHRNPSLRRSWPRVRRQSPNERTPSGRSRLAPPTWCSSRGSSARRRTRSANSTTRSTWQDAESSERCLRFSEPSRCVSEKRRLVRYCVDRYEWPNRAGELPQVLVDWADASHACESTGQAPVRRERMALRVRGRSDAALRDRLRARPDGVRDGSPLRRAPASARAVGRVHGVRRVSAEISSGSISANPPAPTSAVCRRSASTT